MNKPTIITTPSGDQMAVIPLEEYERLVEAAEANGFEWLGERVDELLEQTGVIAA